ncbi:uncharacterized protein C8R40DRAFT_1066503 [Lentinula edodes]|uniref:uncharacterized protein n=1 Tax=Lentinula edodes TaxID=5353 RepID=UPI001E8EDECA|nr:uncharacterized protein C8R40DRAFT_1066503 [Lentinula edodes]KAH7879427.1 hypothetical protein C8R40DRAFT_1066503 [Lentinula edodes]
MSPFLSSTYCMVKHSHIANFPSALSLATGDIVMVLEQQPLGWWYGQLGKKRGWFPKHCVKLINEENSPTKGHPFTTEDGIRFLLPQRPSGWLYDERLRTPQNALSVNNEEEEEAQRQMAGNTYEGVMAQSMTISRLPTLDCLELMQSAGVQSAEEVPESKPETTKFSSNRRPV